jgi:hypothetical protein
MDPTVIRRNKRILLAAVVLLWVLGVGFLLAWHVAMASFDGYQAEPIEAGARYAAMGAVLVLAVYVGIGALLDRSR